MKLDGAIHDPLETYFPFFLAAETELTRLEARWVTHRCTWAPTLLPHLSRHTVTCLTDTDTVTLTHTVTLSLVTLSLVSLTLTLSH